MSFYKPKMKKSSELFARAGGFAIAFIIVLIFFIITSKHEKSHDPRQQFMLGMAKYASFEETKKDELKARNAGFWQYASDTNTSNSMIYLTDRFELKTNGIFWQVKEYSIGLPSKKSTRYMHIVHGYLNPFAKADTSLDSIVCDVHIIRQAYVMGKDTCYGPSNTDTTMIVVANGKRFNFENREYASYDTAGAALYEFFPKGALDVVDKITIYQCPKKSDFLYFARNAVAADMITVKVEKLTQDAVQKIIDAYYRYFLEHFLLASLDKYQERRRGQMKISFDVTWEGKVSAAKIITLSKQYEKLRKSILADIGSWTFPQLKASAPSLHIEREFWF
jgi:hypothetical protein